MTNDVYIGKSNLFGLSTVVEWYFLNSFWQTPDLVNPKDGFQLPIEVRFYLTIPGIAGTQLKYNHLFDFKTVRLNLNDYDISPCIRIRAKRHYMFSLGSEQKTSLLR